MLNNTSKKDSREKGRQDRGGEEVKRYEHLCDGWTVSRPRKSREHKFTRLGTYYSQIWVGWN